MADGFPKNRKGAGISGDEASGSADSAVSSTVIRYEVLNWCE